MYDLCFHLHQTKIRSERSADAIVAFSRDFSATILAGYFTHNLHLAVHIKVCSHR